MPDRKKILKSLRLLALLGKLKSIRRWKYTGSSRMFKDERDRGTAQTAGRSQGPCEVFISRSPGTFLQETVFSVRRVTWLSLKVTRMSRVPQRHNTKERGSILLQFKEKYFKPIKCQANLGSLFSDRKCLSLGLLPQEATAFWRWGAWDPGRLNGFHRPWSQEMEESGCELHFVWLPEAHLQTTEACLLRKFPSYLSSNYWSIWSAKGLWTPTLILYFELLC